MFKSTRAVAVIAFLLASAATRAAELPDAEQHTIESYAAANRACVEWSDGCVVCLRHDDGAFGCSLPGIACEPKIIACIKDAKPAGPVKKDEPGMPK